MTDHTEAERIALFGVGAPAHVLVAALLKEPCPCAECNLATAYLDVLAQLREAGKLREFVEWCMATASWQGYDLHGGDMQDRAEELGLIVKAPADEAFREEYDSDEMFVVAWSPLALRAAIDAARTTEEGK